MRWSKSLERMLDRWDSEMVPGFLSGLVQSASCWLNLCVGPAVTWCDLTFTLRHWGSTPARCSATRCDGLMDGWLDRWMDVQCGVWLHSNCFRWDVPSDLWSIRSTLFWPTCGGTKISAGRSLIIKVIRGIIQQSSPAAKTQPQWGQCLGLWVKVCAGFIIINLHSAWLKSP